VVDQIAESVAELPDDTTLLRTASFATRQSTEVEGVDEPLYPSDLDAFVADTNVIDAGVISTLVVDGALYDTTVLVPDVVLEEIHNQVDDGRRIGEDGLEELEYLRALAEADIIDFEIVETETTASESNVAADHAILSVAQERDVPICSDDDTLLRIAQVSGITAFQLKQELSQRKRLIKRVLSQHGEMSVVELAKVVEAEREELTPSREYMAEQFFDSPGQAPSGDLSKELTIRNLIDQMEHENVVYQSGDRVGLIKDVGLIPTYDALTHSKVSEAITEGKLHDALSAPLEAYNIRLAVPAFLDEWASVQSDAQLEQEMNTLELMDQRHEIDIDTCEPDLGYADILTVDEDYVKQALNGLIRRKRNDYETLLVLRYDSEAESLTIDDS
jgi:rRNA-processing protein FCF1